MSKRIVIAVLLAIGILLFIFGLIQYIQTKQTLNTQNSIISGTFNINGIIPTNAVVTITKKAFHGNSTTIQTTSNITAVDQGVWSFNNVTPGQGYTITAQIIQNGNVIANSSLLTVTAPARDEVLTFNIPSQPIIGTAAISGIIQVNGYIPPNATITIQGRKLGATTFTTVVQNLPGMIRQPMNYVSATPNQTYEVIGILYTAGHQQIGSSLPLVVTAPAANETLTINSQAIVPITPTPTSGIQTPQPTTIPSTSVISGSIDFNGIAPTNSRIVIFERVHGTQNFSVAVDNITPVDGNTWQWTQAAPSTWYDMIAILKQRQSNGTDQDISDSPTTTVAAPAANVVFTLNSSISLAAPGGPITVNCNSISGGTTWNNAQVSFGSVNNAQSYWFQIGTSQGGIQLTNATQNTSNNNTAPQTQTVSLTNGVTYFAQYAYANIPNLPAGSTQFSPFSSTTQLRCNQ